jgi:hypothetical protein
MGVGAISLLCLAKRAGIDYVGAMSNVIVKDMQILGGKGNDAATQGDRVASGGWRSGALRGVPAGMG